MAIFCTRVSRSLFPVPAFSVLLTGRNDLVAEPTASSPLKSCDWSMFWKNHLLMLTSPQQDRVQIIVSHLTIPSSFLAVRTTMSLNQATPTAFNNFISYFVTARSNCRLHIRSGTKNVNTEDRSQDAPAFFQHLALTDFTS